MKSLVTYVYRTEDGKLVEQDYPFGEAPRYIMVNGKRANRFFGSASTVIPEYMKAGSDHELQHYDRQDWRQKKYY